MMQLTLEEVIALLAEGAARIRLDRDGDPELVTVHGSVSGIWPELCRAGWLAPMANGGTFKLSDEGLKSYLRSTDELGDGRLIPPYLLNESQQQ